MSKKKKKKYFASIQFTVASGVTKPYNGIKYQEFFTKLQTNLLLS